MNAKVEPSPEIWSRGDFPYLCFHRLLYKCVEVGVDRGEFAAMFLDRFPQCSDYYAIDSYKPFPESPLDRNADYLWAVSRLERHASKARLIKADSIEASRTFADSSVDFVYVDGNHTYEAVKADLKAWFPKLSEKGILAGHDFDDELVHAGVKEAVMEFAEDVGRPIYSTAVEPYIQEANPSWYLYKQGIPGADWRRC